MGRVLHASYSGYFPFCIYEGIASEVGSGTAFPLGMSLESAMLLYWRIRKFTLTSPNGVSSIASLSKGFPQQEIASEEQIVCGEAYFNGFVYEPFPIDLTTAEIIMFQSVVIKKVGNIYYPNLRIGFTDVAFDGGGNYTTFGFFDSYNPEMDQIIYGQFNFLEIGEIDLYVVPGSVIGNPQFGNISVLEYWSYGGTWNTSTGQPA